jgi:uncharacterized membrane protein
METAQGSLLGPAHRLNSIDALRGAIMVIMALDHVRDFIHRGAMNFSPTDLTRTTPLLFFTRWITHFCAPVFMFTAGMGAYLWWKRNRTKGQLSQFLVTRGLWLVVLELTVMRLAYNFNFSLRYPILLLVLWVLGVCMIGLAGLVALPIRLLAWLSIAVIALHNCLDGVQATRFGPAAGLWNLIHQVGAFQIGGISVVVGYPIIPWIAVMAAGFCFGQVFEMPAAVRRRILFRTGAICVVAFIVIRFLNGYGDPAPWSTQKTAIGTLLSFLNCTKYPPSLDFLLMTLGPALLLLGVLDQLPLKATNWFVVFGRVPLFYFIAHFYAAHAVGILLALLRYGRASFPFLFQPMPSMGGARQLFPADFGYDLWVAYAVWALIVVCLYPACRWFAKVKATRRTWWLSYL